MTDSDVVVNAVYVDPGDSNRVLLATDRGGVLTSQDAGARLRSRTRESRSGRLRLLLVDRDNPECSMRAW